MKLRSYMRGLGIGIIVSTLLVGFAYRNVSPSMTDDEIKAAAEKLGMVEEDKTLITNSQKDEKTLPDTQDNNKESDGEEKEKPGTEKIDTEGKAESDNKVDKAESDNTTDKAKNETDETKENKSENDDIKTDNEAAKADSEPDADSDVTKKAEESDKSDSEQVAKVSVSGTAVSHDAYVITIAKGSGSDTVSRLLEMGGLVKSSQDFDQYLCNNGYDSKIVEGDHSIPADASYEEIAKIITTRE